MTNAQIVALQSYVLACVRYETAHCCEKNAAMRQMMEAQSRLYEVLRAVDRQPEAKP